MTHLNDTMSTSLLTTHKKNAHLTKEERVHTGYKMLENTDLKLSVFQHFFILVSY